MKNSGKPFRSVLDFESRQLALCLDKIAAQRALLAIVKSALPRELAAHAMHCVASGLTLLLYSDSAGWASQIRFFHQPILDELHTAGHHQLVKLQVRIVMPSATQRLRLANLPSTENVKLIGDQAQRIERHDELAAAMSRLAATLNRRVRKD
jgi:hypothetical protein